MRYKVVGWDSYDSSLESMDHSWAMYQAIVDELKEKNYVFSGYCHQELSNGAPVLNNGMKVLFSQRGWGGAVANAQGEEGDFAYAHFAFDCDDTRMPPDSESYDSYRQKAEYDLQEEFVIVLSKEELAEAERKDSLKMKDDPLYAYIDCEDTVAITDGERIVEFLVTEVLRYRGNLDIKLAKL